MDKLNAISDPHVLHELMATLDREIAELGQETIAHNEIAVDLSSKMIIKYVEAEEDGRRVDGGRKRWREGGDGGRGWRLEGDGG
jgi:hypothetical protein